MQSSQTQELNYIIKDLEDINDRIWKIEIELAPEKWVVAYNKAEKDSEIMIEEDKKKSSWGNYLASSMWYYMGYNQDDSQDKS